MVKNSLRNRVAHRLANAVLRIADSEYRSMIAGSVEYGLRSAARDALEKRKAPEDWRPNSPEGLLKG